MPGISTAYINTGANRTSSGAVISCTELFAYAAGSSIAVWDTFEDGGVFATLNGHKGDVTTIKIVKEQDRQVTLVSGDSVGEVRVWQQEGRQFRCVLAFTAHKGATISALGVEPISYDILTGGSDGVVRRWRGEERVAEIDLRGKLPLDLDVACLPGSEEPLLIIGCTDRKVQLWTLGDKPRLATSLEGHEDWVRCVAVTPYPSSCGAGKDLLLATGAQDNYIRLWRIAPATVTKNTEDILDEFERRLGDQRNVQLSTKAHVLVLGDRRYEVTLEALLVGHEAGLTNVHWSPADKPILLSTASDNSMIIWSPTPGASSRDGIWVPEHRFGSFGGRGLAFFGAVWGAFGTEVIATGWTGGVERWKRDDDGEWTTAPGVTGHFGAVQSVAWDPKGNYILSTGSDQTSRIHARCQGVWAEIARPQIHGYDMVDAAFLSPFRFCSAAEEKVMRVFDATEGFAASLRSLGVCEVDVDEATLPKGATVPPLGLSNRALGKPAVDLAMKVASHSSEEKHSVSAVYTTVPTEEELNSSTLWPEIEKIYGHGYELTTLAASNAGDIVATACRASSAEHAVVRINSTTTWAAVGAPLSGHTLTVTRIAFSPDDRFILTASRDRSWRLFERTPDGYVPFAQEDKAHSRMVLDAAWGSDSMFATASRDRTVKLWTKSGGFPSFSCSATIQLGAAATAVAVKDALVAVGTESGAIEIYDLAGSLVAAVAENDRHASAITRLAWSPTESLLASAGDDRSVRVFTVSLQL